MHPQYLHLHPGPPAGMSPGLAASMGECWLALALQRRISLVVVRGTMTAVSPPMMTWEWLFSQSTVAVLINWPAQAAGGTA